MEIKIRQDLVQDGLSIPVFFLDDHTNGFVANTDTLMIACEYCTDGEELNNDGYNIIVRLTDPSVSWDGRLAFAMSSDFDWNI